jgi:hypothetical protein
MSEKKKESTFGHLDMGEDTYTFRCTVCGGNMTYLAEGLHVCVSCDNMYDDSGEDE